MLAPWKKSYDQPTQHIKRSSQSYGFSSSHVWCEGWTIKKAERWRIDAFELERWRRLLTVPWTARSSNQSILKEISPEYSLEGLMLKPKLHPIFWPPDVKNWLIGKDSDAGKDWWQEEKGMTEDEMVGWHHWLNGHEFEQAPGVGEGQGNLAYCSHGVMKSKTRLSDWSELKRILCSDLENELQIYIHMKVKMLVIQLCWTLADPMNCSPPDSPIHGILQTKILEWVAISFSRGSSWSRDQTQVSCIAGRFFTVWAMGFPSYICIFWFN